MKLKSLLKVLDRYTFVEIEDKNGVDMIRCNYVGVDDVIEVGNLLTQMIECDDEILNAKVGRVYYDFGRFNIELDFEWKK